MKTYLSAIAFHSRISGYPLVHENMPRLHYLFRGIRRIQAVTLPKRRLRIPISVHHLSALRQHFQQSYYPHDALMLWAASTSAFFGLLRSSEYTCPTSASYIPATLLRSHLSFNSDFSRATLHLPFSKTDPFGRGASVQLTAIPSPFCPVSALAHYTAARRSSSGPLFIFSDGAFLTRAHLAGILRAVFPLQSDIHTHSFRIGGATALASAGVPEYLIQIMGRWSSDSFLRYIHIPDRSIASFHAYMALDAPR